MRLAIVAAMLCLGCEADRQGYRTVWFCNCLQTDGGVTEVRATPDFWCPAVTEQEARDRCPKQIVAPECSQIQACGCTLTPLGRDC